MMDIQELKRHLDIIALAETYCGGLVKHGNCYWAKINPLRQEKTSSLYFYPESQSFHDFGSNEHGDAIDFYCQATGLSLPDALKQLGAKGKFETMPAFSSRRAEPEPKRQAKTDFSSILSSFEELTLRSQGHREEALAIAPAWLFKEAESSSIELLKDWTRYDQKNNTLVVIIKNKEGEVVGMKRRRYHIHGELKKWVAIKGSEVNHCQSRVRTASGLVFIVEGIKDGLNALLLGWDFIALPSAGCQKFTQQELNLLMNRNVVLIADVDQPGISCMQALAKQIDGYVESYFILDLRQFLSFVEASGFDPTKKIDFADAVRLHADSGGKPLFCSYGDCFKAQLIYYVHIIQQTKEEA